MSGILMKSIRCLDYYENYYHGMLNGIFTSRGYSVDSNDEAGLGRLDLMVTDDENNRVLLMEFKRSGKEQDPEADCDIALNQIAEKSCTVLIPAGYALKVISGISFYAKTAKVKFQRWIDTQPRFGSYEKSFRQSLKLFNCLLSYSACLPEPRSGSESLQSLRLPAQRSWSSYHRHAFRKEPGSAGCRRRYPCPLP